MNNNYSLAQLEFIKENVLGRTNLELAVLFNQRFNTNIMTVAKIKSVKKKNSLKSGLTGRFEKGHTPFTKGKKWDEYMSKEAQASSSRTTFKKGNRPQQYRPVGSERITVDGYIEIKVADPNKWRPKHRVIWEELYGQLEHNQVIIFLDQNKQNLNLDNLMAVTKNEVLRLNKNKSLIKSNRDLNLASILVTRIKYSIN